MMKAIIFDLDDTLYSRQEPFRKAMETVFPQLLTQMTEREGCCRSLILPKLYRSFAKHGYDLFDDSMNGTISMEYMYIERIARALRDYGFSITDEQALTFQERYNWEQEHLTLSPCIRSMLDQCRSASIFLGVVTNGKSDHQRVKYEALGLSAWIDPAHFLASGDIDIGKPDPRILQEAQRRWKLDPNETWYAGDSLSHDAACAHLAGWHSIWFDRPDAPPPSQEAVKNTSLPKPDITVHSEEELRTRILGLLAAET